MKSVGERLRELRKAAKLTGKELSKKLGVSESAISHWENDTNIPHSENLLELAIILRSTPDYIMSGKGEVSDPRAVASAISPELGKLLDDFLSLSPEHRQTILALAEVLKSAPTPKTSESQ